MRFFFGKSTGLLLSTSATLWKDGLMVFSGTPKKKYSLLLVYNFIYKVVFWFKIVSWL